MDRSSVQLIVKNLFKQYRFNLFYFDKNIRKLGRCLSPRLKHTSRVRERISRGDTVNLEVPDILNARFPPKKSPAVLTLLIIYYKTTFKAPRNSVTIKEEFL
jgi:hypothetical protein